MNHSSDNSIKHPVTPLSYFPPHIQAMFGYKGAKLAGVTKGGRLACSCGNVAGGCTCKAATEDAQASVKPTISNAAAIGAVLALKHLDGRLQAIEQRMTGVGQGQSSDLDQRLAIAQQKHSDMVKELRAEKLEETVSRHEAEQRRNDNIEPADPKPGAKDDRAKFGRFDPSSGDQAQKTSQHPVGDALVPMPSKDAYAQLMAGHKAKKFFDRELETKRAWIADIEESNKQRWN